MLNKRLKFILTSIILSLGFIGLQFVTSQYKIYTIGFLAILTFVLFYLSLKEGLDLNSTLLVLILPVAFTIGVGVFWFLLPSSFLTIVPVVIIYGFSIYTLCLTANIYTVSTIRTIALLRAARGVGFVLTLLASFLIYDVILSLRLNIIITSLLIGAVSFPLYLQGLWTIVLNKDMSKSLLVMSGVFSLVMTQIAMILHFWPSKVVVSSLFLTVSVYMMLGLGQVKLEGRLFPGAVREYLTIGVIVFIGMLIATSWRL